MKGSFRDPYTDKDGKPFPLESKLTQQDLQKFLSEMVDKTDGRKLKYIAGAGFIKNIHNASDNDLNFLFSILQHLEGTGIDGWNYIMEVAVKVYPDKTPEELTKMFSRISVYTG